MACGAAARVSRLRAQKSKFGICGDSKGFSGNSNNGRADWSAVSLRLPANSRLKTTMESESWRSKICANCRFSLRLEPQIQATGQFDAVHTDSSTKQYDPEAEYRRRLEVLRATESRCRRRDTRLGIAKLTLLLAGIALAIWILTTRLSGIYWVLVPVLLFVPLAVLHERVVRSIRRCSRAIGFYEHGLWRLDDAWAGKGESGDRFLDASHPYARDLDLFGKGSLFELLCAARTRAGEETLAGWLLAPATAEEAGSRNAGVAELRNRLDLREDLAVLGEDVRLGVRPGALKDWAEGQPLLESRVARVAVSALSALWLLSMAAWAAWDWRALAFVSTLVNLGVSYGFRKQTRRVVLPVEKAAQDLGLLSEVLARLEREDFSAPKLTELQGMLQTEGTVPSRRIARLSRLVASLESRRGLLVGMLDPFVLWSLQLAFGVEAWRKRFGAAVPRWLGAVGEIEVLSSLAGYAYEHPADAFAEFTAEGPCFEAEGFAHPLIPESQAVRNDLRLGRELKLVVVSGPNMAGKSTLVRAVGINAVLAQCGAPVRAQRLRLSSLSVAASVCVLDSLQGGVSRFYAEISRLKLIVDLTERFPPVLYLLDELLQGTNSHDRRTGAEAIVRRLFERGAIGLVTTHDLALAEIVESLGPRAGNFHFEDRFEDGRLHFDYHLMPGIVRTSNALELMRSIGLDV